MHAKSFAARPPNAILPSRPTLHNSCRVHIAIDRDIPPIRLLGVVLNEMQPFRQICMALVVRQRVSYDIGGLTQSVKPGLR